jgi:hypothetical protein
VKREGEKRSAKRDGKKLSAKRHGEKRSMIFQRGKSIGGGENRSEKRFLRRFFFFTARREGIGLAGEAIQYHNHSFFN